MVRHIEQTYFATPINLLRSSHFFPKWISILPYSIFGIFYTIWEGRKCWKQISFLKYYQIRMTADWDKEDIFKLVFEKVLNLQIISVNLMSSTILTIPQCVELKENTGIWETRSMQWCNEMGRNLLGNWKYFHLDKAITDFLHSETKSPVILQHCLRNWIVNVQLLTHIKYLTHFLSF